MPRADHEGQVWQRHINSSLNQPLAQTNQAQTATILIATCLAAASDSANPETEADGQASRGLGLILDSVMVGTHAGGMVVEIALAIEMSADAVDLCKTVYPHPTPAELTGVAAEVARWSCTDLPPVRK